MASVTLALFDSARRLNSLQEQPHYQSDHINSRWGVSSTSILTALPPLTGSDLLARQNAGSCGIAAQRRKQHYWIVRPAGLISAATLAAGILHPFPVGSRKTLDASAVAAKVEILISLLLAPSVITINKISWRSIVPSNGAIDEHIDEHIELGGGRWQVHS